MGKKVSILTVLCFYGLLTFAQSDIKGTVTLYNSRDATGKPIPVSETLISTPLGDAVASD